MTELRRFAGMQSGHVVSNGTSTWRSSPGAFDLLDAPATNREDLDFLVTAAQLRGPSLRGVRERWESLRRRLQRLVRREVLFADVPAEVTMAAAYPPPDGRVSVSFRRELGLEAEAEFKVFGMNFGRGGSVSLASAFSFVADEKPLELVVKSQASATRYSTERGDRSVVSVDLANLEEIKWELRVVKEPPPAFDPGAYDPSVWSLVATVALSQSRSSQPVTWKYPDRAQSALFKAGVGVPPIARAVGLELSADVSCKRADAYSAEFSLAHGSDYAFFAPAGSVFVIPYCVRIGA